MMKYFSSLIFSLFVCGSLLAQKTSKAQFVKDSLEIVKGKMVRPQFKFDNRLTWYEGQTLVINGVDVGVLLKDKMRITLGYYRLEENLNAFKETVDNTDLGAVMSITYGSLNTEFIYKNTRFFSLGMPLEIGIGQGNLRYKNFTTNEVYKSESGFLVVTYFGLSATFKPIRWIGLKAIVGYRKTAFTQVKNFNFDGPFTSVGLNIDFQEIVRDIKMYRLQKKHKRGNNIGNAVDLITD